MNYESLHKALYDDALALGYHPTSAAMLHKTLSTEGFPIALIAPPKVVRMEGDKERKTTYHIKVNFLCANAVGEQLCTAEIARLASDCDSFLSSLRSHAEVCGLQTEEILAVSGALTVAGEVGLSLKATVEAIECRTVS